ncbi:aldo/keto reductase [Micromonospora sp. LZ34]
MRRRPLGRTGIQVSPHCLGTMMFVPNDNPDYDDCIRIIHQALDASIKAIDTADVYGGDGETERIVGKALRGRRQSVGRDVLRDRRVPGHRELFDGDAERHSSRQQLDDGGRQGRPQQQERLGEHAGPPEQQPGEPGSCRAIIPPTTMPAVSAANTTPQALRAVGPAVGRDSAGVPVGFGVPGEPAAEHQLDGQVQPAVPGTQRSDARSGRQPGRWSLTPPPTCSKPGPEAMHNVCHSRPSS